MNANHPSATSTPAVTRVIFSLAVLVLATQDAANATSIVVPNQYESAEAPASGGIPTGPFRFQQLFAASQFSSLPPGQRTIASFAMRPDASVSAPLTATLLNTVIRMSTTNRNPGELSSMFSENVGADEIVVFQGDLTLSTANTGPLAGPKDFDFVFQLQTPFTYDPTAGNLIFDVTTAGTDLVISQRTDFVAEPGSDFEHIAAFTAGATVATGRWGGNVIQFRFVPEPSAAVLLVCSAWVAAVFLRNRSKC